jgi:guanosine-3',5'-bis(diphosphate) 3'-pyrophosphohydrolase
MQQALIFASNKHSAQKRKFNGEPYVNHCIRVSQIVQQYSDNRTLAIAAFFASVDDTLEDTETTYDELVDHFGQDVATLVKSLTNNTEEIKRLGKTAYLEEKVNMLTRDELLIKLADRLDNIGDLSVSIREWSDQYAQQTETVFFSSLRDENVEEIHMPLLEKIRVRLDKYYQAVSSLLSHRRYSSVVVIDISLEDDSESETEQI